MRCSEKETNALHPSDNYVFVPKKHFGSKTALLSDIGAARARASGPIRGSTRNARQA